MRKNAPALSLPAVSKLNPSNGFTLIEILVVVIIIGIITAIVVPYYINARKDARDSRRISDLQSVATALEQYYAQNKNYPPSIPVTGCDPLWGWCKSTTLPTSWVPTISPTYMSVLPKDPLNSSTSYYVYTTLNANSVNFKLISIGMEGDKGKQAAREDGGCRTDQYELFSSGAQSWRYGTLACDQ